MAEVDFLSQAPKFITARFNSINIYVWQTLFPDSEIDRLLKGVRTKAERKMKLSKFRSISDEAAVLVFVFLLNRFFIQGSQAAKDAVDTFKELGEDGFYIGNSYFSERNHKVEQGDKIAAQLIDSIKDEKARNLILQSKYVSEILNEYKKFI